MPYSVTFWSKPYLSVTGKTTAHKNTATEAWILVQQLTASDEEVEIIGPSGHTIGWQELKMLAEREAH